MQFWGLMIGHVSNVDDIRLTFEGRTYKNWLYINKDFSYNLFNQNSMDKVHTSLKKLMRRLRNILQTGTASAMMKSLHLFVVCTFQQTIERLFLQKIY